MGYDNSQTLEDDGESIKTSYRIIEMDEFDEIGLHDADQGQPEQDYGHERNGCGI